MTKWSLVLKVKLSSGVCGFYCWNPSRLDIDGYVHCHYASLRKFVWTDWLSKHNRAAQLTLKFSSMIWWSSLRRWVEQLVSGHLAPLEAAYIQSGPVGELYGQAFFRRSFQTSRCKKSRGPAIVSKEGRLHCGRFKIWLRRCLSQVWIEDRRRESASWAAEGPTDQVAFGIRQCQEGFSY